MVKNFSSLPLVSIIVPVFNGGEYLRESLDSIIAQSYPQTEILVMDDASSDNTPKIIASYGKQIKSHRQPQNRGIYENVNDGISLAKGDYIAFYHADDVYHPNIIEHEVKFLEYYREAGAVFCQAIFIDTFGREIGQQEIPPEIKGGKPLSYKVIFNALLEHKNSIFWCPTSMIRASVYRDVGFFRPKQFHNTSDLDMWLRVARKYQVGILEDYLIRYRFGHGSSSQNYHSMRTDEERYFLIMDKYLEGSGRAVANPQALTAYEAHRAEDRLLRSARYYIIGDMIEATAILRKVRIRNILVSSNIQRGRLLILLVLLRGLVRLPRIRMMAHLFYMRWGIKKYRQGKLNYARRFNRLRRKSK